MAQQTLQVGEAIKFGQSMFKAAPGVIFGGMVNDNVFSISVVLGAQAGYRTLFYPKEVGHIIVGKEINAKKDIKIINVTPTEITVETE